MGNTMMFGKFAMYQVEHIETFKKLKGFRPLKNVIFTLIPWEDDGLSWLEVNKEYLLSGLVRYGFFIMSKCSQMNFNIESCKRSPPHEWVEVPTNQKEMLNNGTYSKCTKTAK
uniref:DUF1985 domain-containing protein n=1 Tax=Strongyloides papillosus TaxID=174720 RepID=A0A0N5B2T3_STREA